MKTLNETLTDLGFHTAPAGNYQKFILDSEDVVLFKGDAHAVWTWLRETGRVR